MSEHGRFFCVFLYVCVQEHLQKDLGQQIFTATKKQKKKMRKKLKSCFETHNCFK